MEHDQPEPPRAEDVEDSRNLPDPRVVQDACAERMYAKHSRLVEVRGKRLRVVHIPVSSKQQPAADLPVLFFLHGFGGCVEQWASQLTFFKKRLPMVALELVGHGNSEVVAGFEPYTWQSVVQDLAELFQRYRGRQNIIVAHSYGCSLATFLYQELCSKDKDAADSICAMVLISLTLDACQPKVFEYLPWMPLWFLDAYRRFHTWGEENSASVMQFVDVTAPVRIKQQQLHFNRRTQSSVVRALGSGARFAGLSDYAGLPVHLLFVCGKNDLVTPAKHTIAAYSAAQRPHGPHIVSRTGHSVMLESSELLNALISVFLRKKCNCVTLRMDESSTDVQLDNSAPKWALKNHAKWKVTQCESLPCGQKNGFETRGGLVACKVFREDDEEHSPTNFKTRNPHVGLVIDISLEQPPYLPESLAPVQYIKVPTQSKVLPTEENVQTFFDTLVEYWAQPDNAAKSVAVHCHYGFNRTGFLICCFLCAHRGYTAAQALDEFAQLRPPGIKHAHFREALFARYPTP